MGGDISPSEGCRDDTEQTIALHPLTPPSPLRPYVRSPPSPHSVRNARARMFGQKQNKKEITANEEAVNVAGRYGRFKLSEGSKIGKEGEPFVDAPVAREALKIPTKYDSGLRLQCTEALNHPLTEIFMIILTIIALYITDSNQVSNATTTKKKKGRRQIRSLEL
jgi:hypothetical protein